MATSAQGKRLKEVADIKYGQVPTEVHHVDLQPAIDLTMGVEGRDLGHVCDDVIAVLHKYGKQTGEAFIGRKQNCRKGARHERA